MFNRLISSLLHPIIFPLVGSSLYLFSIPYYITKPYKLTILLVVFIGSYLLPILLLYLFKKLQLIQSFHLPTVEERKFPILFFAFLAILIGKMLFKIALVNDLAVYFIAGGFAMLLVYLFLFKQIKVSIHTLGIGGLIGFIIQLSYTYHQNFLLPLVFLFLIFGLIAKARISLQAHNFNEVILGFVLGVGTQLVLAGVYQNM